MDVNDILNKLSELGNAKTKKIYINYGAKEDLIYGVAVKDLKPIAKQLQKNNLLAMELFNTLNYDAMYLAGMIIDTSKMTKEDFNNWISKAYFHMIGDYIVSVTLAESSFALELASEWINALEEIKQSAGWYTYTWVIGVTKDELLNKEHIKSLLNKANQKYNKATNIVKNAIENFIIALAIQYQPLHEEAYNVAKIINNNAKNQIEKAIQKNRIGFKRKNVRCK